MTLVPRNRVSSNLDGRSFILGPRGTEIYSHRASVLVCFEFCSSVDVTVRRKTEAVRVFSPARRIYKRRAITDRSFRRQFAAASLTLVTSLRAAS